MNDGSTNNVDYSTYFTLASCVTNNYGLWYNNSSALYPTTVLQTAGDDYKVLCFTWTADGTRYVYVNGVQEASLSCPTAFDYTNVGRMTVAMNSALDIENAYVRVGEVLMYDKQLSAAEVAQNFRVQRERFGV